MPVQIDAALKSATHAQTQSPNDKLIAVIGQSAVDGLDCITATHLRQDLAIMESYVPTKAIACGQITTKK